MNDFDNKITFAKETLDRTLNLINNCDLKATTILALTGVCLTLFCADGTYKDILLKSLQLISSTNYIYKFLCIIGYLATCSYLYGLYKLIRVLVPQIDMSALKQHSPQLTDNSLIFFGDISKKSYEWYKNEFISLDSNAYFNDLLSQVYINSHICSVKFTNYTTGLKYTSIGIAILVVVISITILLSL